MKRRTLHLLFLVTVMGIGLAGCRSDVKLNDVTIDSKVGAKFGLPIGEMTVTLGDVIGLIGFGNDMQVHIDSIDSVLVLTVDKHYDNEFHAIELTDYTGTVESDSPVKNVISSDLIPAGTKEEVPFEMEIKFDGVNDNTSDERIDSMVIERAAFTTRVTNNFGLKKEDIDRVEMVLGPQFRRAKGTRQDLPDFDFDKDIRIELDNFTLVMMEDDSKAPGIDNVVNKATITFLVHLNYKPDKTFNPMDPETYLPLTPASAFHFSFKVEMMTYTALFGYFEPGKDTHDKDAVNVDIHLPGSDSIVFAPTNPKIVMQVTYGMSIPLSLNINEIKAIHPDGSETQATWKGKPTHIYPLDEVLPIDAPIDGSVSDYITMSSDPEQGHIDNMFKREVKSLGYDYKLDVNRNAMADLNMYQFRMTHNTKFGLDFHFEMPFEFGKDLHLNYSDEIKDINLERVKLDSLAAMVPGGVITSIDSAKLTVYLIITNEIPVAVNLDARLLDEYGNELPIVDGLQNLQIKPATMAGKGNVVAADPVIFAASVKTEEFDTLAKTRSMRLTVGLGDGQNPSTFITNKKLHLKAGVTADIQAVLNLSLNQNNTNQQQQ